MANDVMGTGTQEDQYRKVVASQLPNAKAAAAGAVTPGEGVGGGGGVGTGPDFAGATTNSGDVSRAGTQTNATATGGGVGTGPDFAQAAGDVSRAGTQTNATTGAVGGDVSRAGSTTNTMTPAAADVSRAPGPVAIDRTTGTTPATATSMPATGAGTAPAASPTFDQSWLGGADQWASASQRGATVPWQLMMATHGGDMTPEQKAYAQQQIDAGANAANPYAAAHDVAPTTPPPSGNAGTGETPAGAATPATPAAGTPEDLWQKAIVQQMTQQEVPSVNDAAIKAQLDPLRIENQRAMEAGVRSDAEHAFAGGGEFGNPERVAAQARMGEKTGLQGSMLVGQELSARRQQIQQALAMEGSRMSDQERNALEEKLKGLDIALAQRGQDIQEKLGLSAQDIQRLGINQQGALGMADIGLRRDLGTQGNNLQLLSLLMNNRQAGEDLAGRLGISQAQLNQQAMQSLLGGGG